MTELEIAGYLDRGLSSSDRDRVETHLVECADCRQSVVETQKLVRAAQRPRRLMTAGALAAMAAALLLMVRTPLARDDIPAVRSDAATGPPPLLAYGPIGNTDARPIRFVWGSASGAVSYRLTVSESGGATLWSAATSDTVAFLPDSIPVRPAESHAWVVDAILDDGSTLSTGHREFVPSR